MTDRSTLLTEIIYKNPGLHFSEIIRVSGLKNGVLTHYLNKLESLGVILIKRERDKTRFFSPKINLEEIKVIKFLRKETSRKIISLLLNNDMEFHEIVKKVGKSSPTISQNLSELLNNDLIIFEMKDSKKIFYIKQNSLIQKLIKKYQFD
ncbi:winged helix-turn-helix transcriptional regulator [Nitrosopumilus sp.]|uniref:winged helix-turn-helix transcriptional regulator n=1 Tax=Nitrosopumilus sp. TaxID=2024843 RepID=UPI00247EFBC5|nr:winged helix-turn-helix transcriptional regulator [Nitrosopumilus sp.]MCV0430915.1 winged helix-turn-helix transcriptional regulator [Nitrosopumilus sp.]